MRDGQVGEHEPDGEIENRRGGAQPERERHGDAGSEAPLLPGEPQCVAEVALDVLDQADAAGVACLFLYLLHATEGDPCLATGLLRRHPFADQTIRFHREMELQLVVQIPLHIRAAQQRQQAVIEIGEHQVVRMTRLMAATSRCHASVSLPRWARPLAVRS